MDINKFVGAIGVFCLSTERSNVNDIRVDNGYGNGQGDGGGAAEGKSYGNAGVGKGRSMFGSTHEFGKGIGYNNGCSSNTDGYHHRGYGEFDNINSNGEHR